MRDNLIIVYTPTKYSFMGLNANGRAAISYSARELTNCKEERGIYHNILLKVGNRAKGSHTWGLGSPQLITYY
jgi:hypothetical protein